MYSSVSPHSPPIIIFYKMDESDEEIQLKIHSLLDLIHQLKIKRESVKDEPDGESKAHLLQSDIFRHFAIIDWMRKGLSSEEMISTVTNEVLTTRRETRSELSDLERFPILKTKRHEDGGRDQLECFPYMQLLPEIREKILGNLTSPLDKLNILKAFPEEAALMHWDPTNFYFQLIYPILMKHSLLSILDTWRLGRVNPSFRQATFTHFERCMEDSDSQSVSDSDSQSVSDSDSQSVSDSDSDCSEPPDSTLLESTFSKDIQGGPDWCRNNPLLMTAPSFISKTYEDLEELGSRLWHVSIYAWDEDNSILEFPEGFLNYLRQLSNLRVLSVKDFHEIEEEKNKLKASELPELPHLRNLQVEGSPSILEKLLSCYGKTLETLILGNMTKIVRVRGTESIVAPRLSKIEAGDYGGTPSEMISTLIRFTVSPLKVVNLKFHDPDDDFAKNFPRLMAALSTRFGGTLEKLKISVCMRVRFRGSVSDHLPVCCNCCMESSWIAGLSFPKLRKYSHSMATPGSWGHLLQFPNLEELSLNNIVLVGKDEMYESGDKSRLLMEEEELFGLSWDQEEMYKSNIWRLLPHLQKFSMTHYTWKQPIEINISRAECIKFQRKKSKIHLS